MASPRVACRGASLVVGFWVRVRRRVGWYLFQFSSGLICSLLEPFQLNSNLGQKGFTWGRVLTDRNSPTTGMRQRCTGLGEGGLHLLSSIASGISSLPSFESNCWELQICSKEKVWKTFPLGLQGRCRSPAGHWEFGEACAHLPVSAAVRWRWGREGVTCCSFADLPVTSVALL